MRRRGDDVLRNIDAELALLRAGVHYPAAPPASVATGTAAQPASATGTRAATSSAHAGVTRPVSGLLLQGAGSSFAFPTAATTGRNARLSSDFQQEDVMRYVARATREFRNAASVIDDFAYDEAEARQRADQRASTRAPNDPFVFVPRAATPLREAVPPTTGGVTPPRPPPPQAASVAGALAAGDGARRLSSGGGSGLARLGSASSDAASSVAGGRIGQGSASAARVRSDLYSLPAELAGAHRGRPALGAKTPVEANGPVVALLPRRSPVVQQPPTPTTTATPAASNGDPRLSLVHAPFRAPCRSEIAADVRLRFCQNCSRAIVYEIGTRTASECPHCGATAVVAMGAHNANEANDNDDGATGVVTDDQKRLAALEEAEHAAFRAAVLEWRTAPSDTDAANSARAAPRSSVTAPASGRERAWAATADAARDWRPKQPLYFTHLWQELTTACSGTSA